MSSTSEDSGTNTERGNVLVCSRCGHRIIGPQVREVLIKLEQNPDAPVEHSTCPE